MADLVVAIDGTAGSGKSTLARRLARRLGYRYLDSGAMYRAAGWAALERKVDLNDVKALSGLASSLKIELDDDTGGECRVRVDGRDVTDRIRSPAVAAAASAVALVPGVRKALVALQRGMGERGAVVVEGRDIGTVVFPDADVKFYLDADARVRAERRRREQLDGGIGQPLEEVLEELRRRDGRDSTRDDSPLLPAPDAVVIDTGGRTLDDLERQMLEAIEKKAAHDSGEAWK